MTALLQAFPRCWQAPQRNACNCGRQVNQLKWFACPDCSRTVTKTCSPVESASLLGTVKALPAQARTK